MTPAELLTNPFVGPRAFETGDSQFFFGRDQEVMGLLDLLIAERIVLLYSPSGAGKSSLIQAGLRPALAAEGFTVLPVMRVSREMPVGDSLPETFNPYIFSALLSLEGPLPAEQQMPLPELAALDLEAYLNRGEASLETAGNAVLIFDQFEEILTYDPANQAAKAAFFSQVGQALRNPNRWALFSLREDYIAGLDPFLRPIPTRLNRTFRLELLDKSSAQQAMQGPAKAQGVDFTDEAAQQLVNDLARVRVQQRDGQIIEQAGNFVEPVQLQVVCHRLWQRKFPAGQVPGPTQARIEAADVESAGDVDSALAAYYAGRVQATAAKTGISERVIRNWGDTALITPQNIRGQVMRGLEQSQGLANRAIEALVDAHLVRAEDRRGVTWYELAHDRLIKPVKDDNAAWQQINLSKFQRQAALWDRQQRPDNLLVLGDDLLEAKRWVDTHPGEPERFEQEFLAKSQQAQGIADREKRSNRIIHWAALAFGVVALLAITAAIFAATNAAEARRQEATATAALAEANQQKSTAVAALDQVATSQAEVEAADNFARVQQQTAEAALAAIATAQQIGTPNIEQRQTAEAALNAARIAQAQAEAERAKAIEALATSQAAIPPTETPTISPTPSSTATPTETPTSTPVFTPTPTPDQTATAITAAQTRQAQLAATATAEAVLSFPPPGRIVFTSNRLSHIDLYSMKADGSDLKRITTGLGQEANYAAGRIVFSKPNYPTPQPVRVFMYWIRPDGQGEQRIDDIDTDNFEPALSPDGQQVTFVSTRDNRNWEIYLMPANRPQPAKLTCTNMDPELLKWAPAWSPDSQQIAFVASKRGGGEEQYTGEGNIWVMDANGENCTQLTNTPGFIDKYPDWSPDGTEIVFASNRGDDIFRLYRMNNDGSEQRQVPNSPDHVNYPAWSPDGGWFTFSVPTRRADRRPDAIFVMTVEGDHLTNISDGQGEDWYSIWLPESAVSALACSPGTPDNFYIPWRRNHQDLGCPVPPVSVGGLLSWQPFERGHVFFSGELNLYLVAFEDGTWQRIRDGDIQPTSCPGGDPPPEYIRPDGGIGRLWCDASGIGQRLGFAKQRLDQGNGFQQFENGSIWRNEPGGNLAPIFFVFFGQNSGEYLEE